MSSENSGIRACSGGNFRISNHRGTWNVTPPPRCVVEFHESHLVSFFIHSYPSCRCDSVATRMACYAGGKLLCPFSCNFDRTASIKLSNMCTMDIIYKLVLLVGPFPHSIKWKSVNSPCLCVSNQVRAQVQARASVPKTAEVSVAGKLRRLSHRAESW